MSRPDVRDLACADEEGNPRVFLDRLLLAGREWSRSGAHPDATALLREGGRLPWKRWSDGRWWFAVQGEDFHVSTEQFLQYVHQRANARGVRAAVRRTERCVAFRFTELPYGSGDTAWLRVADTGG